MCSARLLEAALASCGEYIRSAAADDAAYGQFAHLASSRRGGGDLRVDRVHARIAVGSLARGHVREPNGKAPQFGALRWQRNGTGSARLTTGPRRASRRGGPAARRQQLQADRVPYSVCEPRWRPGAAVRRVTRTPERAGIERSLITMATAWQ